MTHNSCHNLSNNYINLQVPDLTYNDCPRTTQKPGPPPPPTRTHTHARAHTHTHTHSVGTVSMKGDLNINRVTNIYYPTKPQFRLMQNGGENMMPSITIA
jgi:hypothetical protein